MAGQKPVGVEQQVPKDKDASEPTHTNSLRKAGKRGIWERRRTREKGEKTGRRRKEQEQEGLEQGLHTPRAGRAPSALAVLSRRKQKLSPALSPQCWELQRGLSTHAATLPAHGLLAGAQSARSDSQDPLHPPSMQLL